jgi:hypothetical protein
MFRAAMRAVKTIDDEPSSGFGGGGMGKTSAAVNIEQYDDRTECKWCNRKFAEETAKQALYYKTNRSAKSVDIDE